MRQVGHCVPPPPLKTPTIQVHARPSIRQKNAEPSILVVYNPIILWASISKTVGTELGDKYKKEREIRKLLLGSNDLPST